MQEQINDRNVVPERVTLPVRAKAGQSVAAIRIE